MPRDRRAVLVTSAGFVAFVAFWGLYAYSVHEDSTLRHSAENRVVELVRESSHELIARRGDVGILEDAYFLCPPPEMSGLGEMLGGTPDDEVARDYGPTYPNYFDGEWIELLSRAERQTDLCDYKKGSDYED